LPLILHISFWEVKIRQLAHEPLATPGANLPIKLHDLFQRGHRTNREVGQRFGLIRLTTFQLPTRRTLL